jgi:hypothetical protein
MVRQLREAKMSLLGTTLWIIGAMATSATIVYKVSAEATVLNAQANRALIERNCEEIRRVESRVDRNEALAGEIRERLATIEAILTRMEKEGAR